eukprot:377169_1
MHRLFLLIAITITLTKSYFLGPDKLSQAKSEAYCQQRGSHLASIHSADQFDDAAGLCELTDEFIFPRKKMCYIGLQKVGDSWQWTDNSATDYGFNTITGEAEAGDPWLKGEHSFDGIDGILIFWWDAKCSTLDIKKADVTEGLDDSSCESSFRPICNGDMYCNGLTKARFLEPCDGGCGSGMVCCPKFNICHCKGMTPEQVEEAMMNKLG